MTEPAEPPGNAAESAVEPSEGAAAVIDTPGETLAADSGDDDGIAELLSRPELYKLAVELDSGNEPVTTGDGEPDRDPNNREAARWRVKLRDEQARTAAAAKEVARMQDIVDQMNKAEAIRLASSRLSEGEDLFVTTQVRDLLTDGRVDPVKVSKAVDAVLLRRPNWGIVRSPVRNFASGASSQRVAAQSSWADAVRRPE